MDLYFSPLACSLATRLALYELKIEANYIEVDTNTKRTPDGGDYRAIHPLGLVPVLRTEHGALLQENAAILQYVASRTDTAILAPRDPEGLARLQQWLSFIGTELHKALFVPLLDREAPEGAKQYARSKASSRLSQLDRHLNGRHYLLDHFSVADAYLIAILNWTAATAVDLAPYPAVGAYLQRMRERPCVARALGEEYALYRAQQEKLKTL